MLAVAAARELSQECRTLVVDLDYFNRGLSGLLLPDDEGLEVRPPDFVRKHSEAPWRAKEVSKNLYTVSFPDIQADVVSEFVRSAVPALSQQLQSWLSEMCRTLQCETAVLDCHGGPDSLSFSAALIADKILLVSEPGRVTLYGTLHFLRVCDELDVDNSKVHLVYNKVLESFNPWFLYASYNEKLRNHFGDKPLLAAFPIEMYLTRYFEQQPFITDNFPKSMLARKIQVMLLDLLGKERDSLLPAKVRNIPPFVAVYWRRTFGRTPKLFQLDFAMKFAFIVLLAAIGAFAVLKSFLRDPVFDAALPIVIAAVPMLAGFSALVSYSGNIDRDLIRSYRRGRWLAVGGNTALFAFLWIFPVIVVFLFLLTSPYILPEIAPVRYLWYLILGVSVCYWIGQSFEAYRDFKYTTYRLEPTLKVILTATVLVSVILVLNVDAFRDDYAPVESRFDFRELSLSEVKDETHVSLTQGDSESIEGEGRGDLIWYRFNVERSGEYIVSVISDDGDPTVGLFGPNEIRYISEDDDGGGRLNSRLRVTLSPGTYYLAIREILDRRFAFSVRVSRHVTIEDQ